MTARRHHFISQCYLRAFGIPRKKGIHKVRVFDKKTKTTFETATDNVGLQRDFNRIDAEGVPTDVFETGLARFESDLAPALERTIQAEAFQSPDDRNLVMNLIAAVALRNPRWREQTRKFMEDISKGMMDLALETKERWEGQVQQAKEKGLDLSGDYDDLKRFHENGQYTVDVDRRYQLRLEMSMLNDLLPYLARRGWVFLRAPRESGGFVTSDHPCCLMWSKPKAPSYMRPGFGLKGTEVFFPLAPRLALVGAFEVSQDTAYLANADMVAHFNAAVIDYATRQVYARDLHFHYKFPGHQARKAPRLIHDPNFWRSTEDDEAPEEVSSAADSLR